MRRSASSGIGLGRYTRWSRLSTTARYASIYTLASGGGAPAPRRPAARTTIYTLASDGGAPAARNPNGRTAITGASARDPAAAGATPYRARRRVRPAAP